jgi:hypothetical protein
MAKRLRTIGDLATALWPELLKVAARPSPDITYADLCARLTLQGHPIHHRSRRLHSALGYLVRRCRAVGLPAISAVVVNKHLSYPGAGFFAVAYQRCSFKSTVRRMKWRRERAAVHATNYPAVVP